jgi:hypothetical protein
MRLVPTTLVVVVPRLAGHPPYWPTSGGGIDGPLFDVRAGAAFPRHILEDIESTYRVRSISRLHTTAIKQEVEQVDRLTTILAGGVHHVGVR